MKPEEAIPPEEVIAFMQTEAYRQFDQRLADGEQLTLEQSAAHFKMPLEKFQKMWACVMALAAMQAGEGARH
jgi:hypothetical protein